MYSSTANHAMYIRLFVSLLKNNISNTSTNSRCLKIWRTIQWSPGWWSWTSTRDSCWKSLFDEDHMHVIYFKLFYVKAVIPSFSLVVPLSLNVLPCFISQPVIDCSVYIKTVPESLSAIRAFLLNFEEYDPNLLSSVWKRLG
jgi:hypothetical protein